MRQAFRRTLTLAAQFFATVAACIGCNKSSPEPPEPKEFHWHGSGTDYHHTSVVPPDNADEQPGES